MTLKIELPDKLEAAIKQKANAHGVSPASYVRDILERELTPSLENQPNPPSKTATGVDEPTLEERFRAEAEKWDRETAFLSSTPKMVLHDSYQKIMAMGPDVVPLLLRDLQKNRRSWFWALRHLTQADPVSPADQGNLDRMIGAWVAWGKREGQI